MVVKRGGTVWGAGVNTVGQLGMQGGENMVKRYFVKVLFGGAQAVVAGGEHSMVLTEVGTVWATGSNVYGQLGDGSNDARDNFVQVVVTYAKAVAAGAKHSLVMMRGGSVWSTGYNSHGQLGDGSTTDRNCFMRAILGQKKVVAIAAGYHVAYLCGQFGDARQRVVCVWAARSVCQYRFCA